MIFFAERHTGFNLRHGNDSQLPKVHTTTYEIETISFLGNRLWATFTNYSQTSKHTLFGRPSRSFDPISPTAKNQLSNYEYEFYLYYSNNNRNLEIFLAKIGHSIQIL